MKKFMISALLLTAIEGSAFLGTSSHVVKAVALFQTVGNTNLAGSDSWTRGIKQGTENGQGLYMPYSYYYNGKWDHAAAVSNRGGFKVTVAHGKGTTASVNGKSVPGYSEAWTRADVRPDGQGWSYATDAGQGVKYHR